MSGQMIIIGLFGLFGSLLTAFGAVQLAKNVRLLRSGVRATAIVAGHERSESWDAERRTTIPFFNPIVEFTDAQGRKQRVTLQVGSDRIAYAESYPVRIIYQADDPSGVLIESFSGMWLFVAVPLVLGTILLAVAISVWVFDTPVRMG